MSSNLKRKLLLATTSPRAWLARYGWAEIAGLITGYTGYFATLHATHAAIACALGASIGENLGYYTCILWRELSARRRTGKTLSATMFAQTTWHLIREFGMAELLDSIIVRPGSTYLAVALLGPTTGIVAGKFIADATFYTLVITTHTKLKRKKHSPEIGPLP
jgi:hypothetical protein